MADETPLRYCTNPVGVLNYQILHVVIPQVGKMADSPIIIINIQKPKVGNNAVQEFLLLEDSRDISDVVMVTVDYNSSSQCQTDSMLGTSADI